MLADAGERLSAERLEAVIDGVVRFYPPTPARGLALSGRSLLVGERDLADHTLADHTIDRAWLSVSGHHHRGTKTARGRFMPKPITTDMLHAMTPAQISILHANASARDTPAAHELLQLLNAEGLVKLAKLSDPSLPPGKAAVARAAKAPKARKATPVAHGRRA